MISERDANCHSAGEEKEERTFWFVNDGRFVCVVCAVIVSIFYNLCLKSCSTLSLL